MHLCKVHIGHKMSQPSVCPKLEAYNEHYMLVGQRRMLRQICYSRWFLWVNLDHVVKWWVTLPNCFVKLAIINYEDCCIKFHIQISK